MSTSWINGGFLAFVAGCAAFSYLAVVLVNAYLEARHTYPDDSRIQSVGLVLAALLAQVAGANR